MKNKTTITIIATLGLLILINFISAAGIVSPYWRDYPMEMNFGETRIAEFSLQNMVGTEDITVKAEIKEGNNIATLDQDTFTAPIGTSNTKIPVTITIPKDFNKGIQRVVLEVKSIATEEGGMVTLGTGWTSEFNVILSEKPISKALLIWIIIAILIILIILVIIILLLLLKKKK